MGYGQPSAIVVKVNEIEDGEEGNEVERGWPPGIFSHEYQNKGVKDYPSLMNIKGKEIDEVKEGEEVEEREFQRSLRWE